MDYVTSYGDMYGRNKFDSKRQSTRTEITISAIGSKPSLNMNIPFTIVLLSLATSMLFLSLMITSVQASSNLQEVLEEMRDLGLSGVPNITQRDEPPASTSADTSGFLLFEDLGYKIEYPDDWEGVAPGVMYGLSAFQAPDGSVITVKFIPSIDSDAENIEEFLEKFQLVDTQNVFTSNSTTTLGGLPAFINEGISTYTPTVMESLSGEQGYTDRIYHVWGYSENKEGFYGVLFNADSKAQYDETLPVAKEIIESFTVDEGVPSTEAQTEEPDDSFVGSAGNEESVDGEGGEDDND